MAKLMALFCAFLLSVALAAPVAEETSPASDVKELIEKADPVENDISAPRTDLPPNDGTGVIEETGNSGVVENIADKVEEPMKPEETQTVAETDPTESEKVNQEGEDPVKEIHSEGDIPVELGTNAGDSDSYGTLYEGMEPVDEVVPPPKVAFVLGKGAEINPVDDAEQNDKMPLVFPEYSPEIPNENDQGEYVVLPIGEATAHDYPQEDITPEAGLNQENDMSTAEVSPAGSEPVVDYDVPVDGSVHVDEISGNGNMGRFVPDYDYPVESGFVGPLDYPTSYPPGFFDDSMHYDAHTDGFMEGSAMNDGIHPVEYPDVPSMGEGSYHPDMDGMGAEIGNIVAGLEEKHHPDPISGSDARFNEPERDSPEANYPVYKDQPIIAGAMLSSNIPMAENTHNVDTPVPERVPMGDSSESNAILVIGDVSVKDLIESNSMVPVSNDIDSPQVPGEFIIEQTMENPNLDDKPNIVIELSLNNQAATVNGRPFHMSQAANILNFIEELIAKATFTPASPRSDAHGDFIAGPYFPTPGSPDFPTSDMEILEAHASDMQTNDFPTPEEAMTDFPTPEVAMNDFPTPEMPTYGFTNRFMGQTFPRSYQSSRDMNYYGNSYFPLNNNFDYNPYYSSYNPYLNRGMGPNFDSMTDDAYHSRFGFDSPPRERRFAYNPFWY